MNKKLRNGLLVLLVLGIALCVGGYFTHRPKASVESGNLIQNGDFSDVTDGLPNGWELGMWVTGPGASYLEAVTLADGTTAALVENAAANDARFEQSVAVRENATYRFRARVMAEGVGEGMTGANLSFSGIYGTSASLYDTDGKWEEITLYAHTGKGMKNATVMVRVGGYGAENTGKAWFTDVSLEEVESVPVGAGVLELTTPAPQKKQPAQEDGKAHAIPLLISVASFYAALSAVIVQITLREAGGRNDEKRARLALFGILLLAFAVRLVLALNVQGYGVDMGCFSAWAGRMASVGPAGFYEAGYFCDYPPAYMLVLGVTGQAANLLGVNYGQMGMQLLIKLMPIACDLLLSALLYKLMRSGLSAQGERNSARAALGMAALFALNPAFVVTGSCWGQIDSVLALLLVLMLAYARAGRWEIAIPIFALAVLAKPQAGLLAPLGVAALVKDMCAKENAGRRIGKGLLFGVLVTAVIVIPFSLRQSSALWLADKYLETLSSYNHATLSAGNLMFLLGGNWADQSRTVFFGVQYAQLGAVLMGLSFAAGIAVYALGKGRSLLFTACALTMQLVFVLGTKMHERYILPALALLFAAYVETGDGRLLISAIFASAASAVNIGVVLAFDYLIAPNLWLGYALGAVQLVCAGLTAYTAVQLVRGKPARTFVLRTEKMSAETDGQNADARETHMKKALLETADHHMHLDRRDAVVLLLLTAAYACVGFYKLGAMQAPQTGYTSSAAGESVVIDLGECRTDFRLYYYGGISDTGFSFAVSDDGENYTDGTDAFFDRGECFKWQALRVPTYDASGSVVGASGGMLGFSGRYVRVTFDGAGSALWEIAAVDGAGHVLPVVSAAASGAAEGRGADPFALVDEQGTVPEKPSHENSMYFDEIYHARTGYEHANALYTYETTHPPLGKVFISWCIRLMGMTPFAWRFAGALAGVLMIPAMYLLAMQLTKRTRYAALCAFLLAADCMHFTQTRIATIDSFPVLFMMLMFLCMARWMQMDFFGCRLSKLFAPLALSGLFMGLAIASKWIGCYGAVGLAALFFARMGALYGQYRYALRHRREDAAFERAASTFPRKAVCTLAACVLFFVIVPIVIYGLSYIPYLRAYGPVHLNAKTLKRILDAQVTMFDYHKNLVATHYFASPWYEWPLIVKPMWYYAADYAAPGMASSILAFGNPAVWWTGLAGILFVLAYSVYRHALPALGILPRREDEADRALPIIAVGFLSAYLPWVLVSRLTFIYHYFASVPFIILATAQALRYIERRSQTTARVLAGVLCAAALVLFIGFYPLASGMEVPRAWCDAMNWFGNWMWY